MKTKGYTRFVIIYLLFALLLGACDKAEQEELKRVKAEDWLAMALGWSSYEEMEDGQWGPMLISISDDTEDNQYLLAYQNGIVGDKSQEIAALLGAASAIGDGEAYAARLQTSLYAIQQAFQGAPLTERWIDPTGRYIAALLPQGDAWFMGYVDVTKRSMFTICQHLQVCGSFMNAKSASEIAQAMRDNGWKAIPASAVPVGVRSYFLHKMGWLQKAWFVRLQGVSASPMFVPIGTFLVPESILVPGSGEAAPQQ